MSSSAEITVGLFLGSGVDISGGDVVLYKAESSVCEQVSQVGGLVGGYVVSAEPPAVGGGMRSPTPSPPPRLPLLCAPSPFY